MASAIGQRAIEDAIANGNAILKFISPNDVGLTGSHQCGFYLPRRVWPLYTPHPPTKGTNAEHEVRILWQDGRTTVSCVKWYGKGTRSEYRLTRFGHDFPFLSADSVGDLLVLIPKTTEEFVAYALDLDEDIDDVQAALGITPFVHWGVYENGAPEPESEDECLNRRFSVFNEPLSSFPAGEMFSAAVWNMLEECVPQFRDRGLDDVLIRCVATEYSLFRFVERRLCQPDIARVFRDVDDFIRTAGQIMNRRKARAGRALENHMDRILSDAAIPHVMRPRVDGQPDIVIPSEEAYNDLAYPLDRLFVVGVKTTCKDRWRQVVEEAKRVPDKHLVTLQPGISASQLTQMHDRRLTLVVPEALHDKYPEGTPITILSVARFVETVRAKL